MAYTETEEDCKRWQEEQVAEFECLGCDKFNKTMRICKILGDRPDLPCPRSSEQESSDSSEKRIDTPNQKVKTDE